VANWPVSTLPGIWTSYFLAMAHFINSAAPFPFAWSPPWLYRVGTLTPLTAVGGAMAVGFGLSARGFGGRRALASRVVGVAAVVAYAALAVMAAHDTSFGIPL
jgi:hypothetical protein